MNILKGKNKINMGDLNAEEISEEYNRRLVFEPGKLNIKIIKSITSIYTRNEARKFIEVLVQI